MSLPTLLSHFGIDRKRYVTASGTVVFDGVATTPSGSHTHHVYGAVTPVQTHTFHGDMPEPSDTPTGPDRWWNNTADLGRHIEAVEAAFPGFTFYPPSDELPPCWAGVINTGRGCYTIGVFLRQDKGLPFVTPLKGRRLGVNAGRRWVPSPHLYLNGNLCIASQDDWNSERHTAATAIGWSAHWLAAYTEWRITRRWPVEGAA